MSRAQGVTEAVILMAGMGSRLGGKEVPVAKPLVQVGGRPLIAYALESLARAGVRRIHAVTGATGPELGDEIEKLLPEGMSLNRIENRDWRKQNGISVLCAAPHVAGRFLLAMGDHVYEYRLLERLLEKGDAARTNLAVDRKVDAVFDLDDAMKVRTEGERIVTIAKDLTDYDAIDTGVFLCTPDLFRALARAREEQGGDCSLADGVRILAREDGMRAIDIGDAWWQDVDTPEMWGEAEAQLARLGGEAGNARAQEGVAGEN